MIYETKKKIIFYLDTKKISPAKFCFKLSRYLKTKNKREKKFLLLSKIRIH